MAPAKTTAVAETVAVRCQNIERQIAEATKAISDGLAVSDKSASPTALLEARSLVEFSQLQRRRLVEERVALEQDRLAEAVEIATRAREVQNVVPDLVVKRNALQTQLDSVVHDIAVATFDDNRLYKAASSAQAILAALQSERPVDQPKRQQLQRELRERLESLT